MPDTPDDQPGEAPQHERRDAAARAGDLARMAKAAEDATFGMDGEEAPARVIVPGVISGDVGPKGRISADMRALSRSERATYGEVPPGAVTPGSGWILLVPMILIAVLLIAAVVLVGWLTR